MRTGLFARVMLFSGVFLVFGGVCFGLGVDSPGHLAGEIINVTGIRGGLVVHVGCAGGKLTTALRVNERYIVHGIDTSAENISEARAYIQKRGVYGPVSVAMFDGAKLPYADNMVNLVVSEGLGDVPMSEVMRVLCPEGKAYIRAEGELTITVKPRPDDIDEWTHYLHDSSNNAVAHDKVVAPPRHIQWVGSPRWSRHHDRMASMSALVSSGGRVFYIFDEGPLESIQLPPERYLIARDAFNGVVLWKQPIPTWHTHLWPYKTGHAQLPRRLVAIGDVVYATLGHEVPLVALDAATGKILWTCSESKATEEVIAFDGTLFILATDEPILYAEYEVEHLCMHKERNHLAEVCTWDERERRIMAVDAETGEVLWEKGHSVVPLTLAADGRGVFFHDGERVVRLDRDSGEEIWASGAITRKPTVPTNFGATLVVADKVVLFSGGDRSMSSVAIDDGRTLWTEEHPPSGHNSPEDLLVVGGLVWAGAIAGGRDSGVFTGRDPFTGEVKKEFGPDIDTYWFHHRCYRAKATDRFLMPSRTGIEYVDPETGHWETNHWVRGGCIYGVMPCNGLTYAPPHSCACYIDAKLNGFCALAGESQRASVENTPDSERLQRGPAYGKVNILGFNIDYSNAWPTYRRDGKRSGYIPSAVPAKLKDDWQTKVGGRLSSPVVAEGRVFVASIDRHAVYALDEAVGGVLWSYTAGGRVDSPPTIYRGQAIFGCADGWVYCLRVTDGALVWRYQAAPADRRVMAFEQIESVWPVSGSVLIEDGVVYCVAGRSMFLDGGMRLLRLDAATGKKISETVLDEIDPETGENLQTRLKVMNMPTALPDVLSSDGRHVYMRTQRFDMKGVREHIEATEVTDQKGPGVHLFSGVGFLDGSWFHRGYWTYGKSITSGASKWFLAGRHTPAGRMLVVNDDTVYGFGRRPEYYRWATPQEYHVFASGMSPAIVNAETGRRQAPPNQEKCEIPQTKMDYMWSEGTDVLARAMVLAGKTLFIAGPPDVLDEEGVFANPNDPVYQAQLVRQADTFKGKNGGLLWAIDTADGSKLAEYELSSMPVWDGMAVARGRLFMARSDGTVVCMGR